MVIIIQTITWKKRIMISEDLVEIIETKTIITTIQEISEVNLLIQKMIYGETCIQSKEMNDISKVSGNLERQKMIMLIISKQLN
jgi:hypothetical protein